ncbi:hypothetical protein ACLOJK_036983 [Asimina triloba]
MQMSPNVRLPLILTGSEGVAPLNAPAAGHGSDATQNFCTKRRTLVTALPVRDAATDRCHGDRALDLKKTPPSHVATGHTMEMLLASVDVSGDGLRTLSPRSVARRETQRRQPCGEDGASNFGAPTMHQIWC